MANSEIIGAGEGKDFYIFLRDQFSDLTSAKKFAVQFVKELDQKLDGYGSFSCRAMAYHISQALEGKYYNDEDDNILTFYIDTKYGREIVDEMWGA